MPQKDHVYYDIVIIGAGPAGLSTAVRLKQLAREAGKELSVCVLEKASEVGAHILSGALLDIHSLNELIPDWPRKGAPISLSVQKEQFWLLTESEYISMPVLQSMKNKGSFIISLGMFCRWLAKQAEELGVEIYTGFAATEVLYHADGSVKGVATGDVGVAKDGKPTLQYQEGIELHARQTLFSEGCRGSLTQEIISRYSLDSGTSPQVYGLGFKEIWEVQSDIVQPGLAMHTVGWPLRSHVYGGSFIYHLEQNRIAVGFVVGLDYDNPFLSPFEEFQRFKTHPSIYRLFKNGRRIAYGARTLAEGGIQSLPKLTFPGGAIVGDAAGFLNVLKTKGIHTAMKSGMLAAESVFDILNQAPSYGMVSEAVGYTDQFKKSWLYQELWRARNIRPAFKWGLVPAILYSALDVLIFKGKAPWTFKWKKADYQQLKPASEAESIEYSKPDGIVTFDRLSSIYLAGIVYEENQPVHLHLKSPKQAIDINFARFASPETRYCPAAVYEIERNQNNEVYLQINAQNCIQCKACDIKDSAQNIKWCCPEGGNGPNYEAM